MFFLGVIFFLVSFLGYGQEVKGEYKNTPLEVYKNFQPKQYITTSSKNRKLSYIEKKINSVYKEKNLRLKQFGYELFENVSKTLSAPIPVGDNYVLGPGDEVIIYFWGDPVDLLGLESEYRAYVDREGKIFIPHVGVIYAWGKTVKELRQELEKLLSRKFRNFSIDISVGKLRVFPVYVSGFVNNPGMVLVPSTYTVVEALALAGGVSKNGSLRNIILRRRNGEEIVIDLYDLLINGLPINVKLMDGDVVYVNKIGKTVGIAGSVKRPAIYELKNEDTLEEVINLAGGTTFSTYSYGVKLFRFENNTLRVYNGNLNDVNFLKTLVKDGDLIYIEELKDIIKNYVEVRGHVSYTGKYSVDKYPTLSSLLTVVELLPDTNLYYGEIVRKDLSTGETKVINFVPKEIIEGKTDVKLKPFDTIVFFPEWLYTPITVSGEVEKPALIPYYPDITLLDALREVKFKGELRNLKAIVVFGQKEDNKEKIEEEKEVLKEEIVEGAEKLIGKREKVSRIVYLYDLLVKGEGNIKLTPGTKILIKKTASTEKDKSVTILGEVKKPGVYKLKEGMTLYDLIILAGGYTERAYPKALIFIRERVKKMQEEHLKTALIALQEGLLKSEEGIQAIGGTQQEKALLELTLQRQQRLLRIIQEKAKIGLGRIALDIPEKLEDLKNHPNNIILEDGDFVYVPSKPNYILVLGEVYNQISLPYIKGKTLSYYLEQVGGTTPYADIDNIYVIKANGRVVSKQTYDSLFSFDWEDGKLYFGRDFMDMPLEEGDTIVVPPKLKIPILWRPLIKDVVQIIFQSISTAVLAKRL
ncbi:SLBB domain-containing protein [Aquifex sp.]